MFRHIDDEAVEVLVFDLGLQTFDAFRQGGEIFSAVFLDLLGGGVVIIDDEADMVQPGAVVIDVGITRVEDPETGRKRTVGDVDFEPVQRVAGWISPVPGGVGPVTVAMLLRNTVDAAERIENA